MKDAEKEGKQLSNEQVETTARCVWLLDCWQERLKVVSLPKNRKSKSGKEHTGKGNLGDPTLRVVGNVKKNISII